MKITNEKHVVLTSEEFTAGGEPRWVCVVDYPAVFGPPGSFNLDFTKGGRMTMTSTEMKQLGNTLASLAEDYEYERTR